jgi:hypothetical protein
MNMLSAQHAVERREVFPQMRLHLKGRKTNPDAVPPAKAVTASTHAPIRTVSTSRHEKQDTFGLGLREHTFHHPHGTAVYVTRGEVCFGAFVQTVIDRQFYPRPKPQQLPGNHRWSRDRDEE